MSTPKPLAGSTKKRPHLYTSEWIGKLLPFLATQKTIRDVTHEFKIPYHGAWAILAELEKDGLIFRRKTIVKPWHNVYTTNPSKPLAVCPCCGQHLPRGTY